MPDPLDRSANDRTTEHETKLTERRLPCVLTDDEKMAFGSESARKVQKLDDLNLEKKEVMAGFTQDIKATEKDVRRLSNLVASGIEYRTIECSERHDFYMGRVVVTRTDTGEIVENRPMTRDEAQRRFDL